MKGMKIATSRQGFDLAKTFQFIKGCKYCCTNKECALRAVLQEARKAVGRGVKC